MYEPKLKFKLNSDLDKWTAKEFVTFDKTDMFSNTVLADHPELEKCRNFEKEEKIEFFSQYVNDYYTKRNNELETKVTSASNDWAKISGQFYKLTDELFSLTNGQEYDWPDGQYNCFLSIFNCNPRFIKEKFFQAFYNHPQTVNYVCIHEMLHFAFYDYVEKNFPNEYTARGENGLWKISEVFNDIILRQSDFIDITGQTDPPIYAQSREELNSYMALWQQNPKTDLFLKNYFKK